MEIIRTKREYNKRKRQLLSEGFIEGWTHGNTAAFYNYSTVARVILKQGWKRGYAN